MVGIVTRVHGFRLRHKARTRLWLVPLACVSDRSVNHHRVQCRAEDRRSHLLVDTNPRVDGEPVCSGSGCVIADGELRMLMLGGRPHGRDHPRQVGFDGELDECLQYLDAERATLSIGRNDGRHDAECVRRTTLLTRLDRGDERSVVPIRKRGCFSVPRERDTPSARNDTALLNEQDVVIAEVGVDAIPIERRCRIMKDELRPALTKHVLGLMLQAVRRGRGCDDLRSHLRECPRGELCSHRPPPRRRHLPRRGR